MRVEYHDICQRHSTLPGRHRNKNFFCFPMSRAQEDGMIEILYEGPSQYSQDLTSTKEIPKHPKTSSNNSVIAWLQDIII